MCLYPILIENKKYRANNKNGGNIPPIYDKRTRYVPVGCGQCIECRKQKARSWQVRLLEDIKTNTNGKFVTLTFSNQSINELNQESIKRLNKKTKKIEIIAITNLTGYYKDNAIATIAIRRFTERFRKIYNKSIRHWLVTEIGHKGTENIHLHGIIWTDIPLTEIEQIWNYGYMWKGYKKNGQYINYVNNQTVNYICKYIHKIDQQHKTFISKILTSPGIGANYTNTNNSKQNTFNGTQTNELYRTSTGHQISMPIYFRNKLYTDEEKEKLWLQKLDKEERWICGEKVNIAKDYKDYDSLLKYHRNRSAELGYINHTKDWELKKYEEQRRTIMQETRLAKANSKRPSVQEP